MLRSLTGFDQRYPFESPLIASVPLFFSSYYGKNYQRIISIAQLEARYIYISNGNGAVCVIRARALSCRTLLSLVQWRVSDCAIHVEAVAPSKCLLLPKKSSRLIFLQHIFICTRVIDSLTYQSYSSGKCIGMKDNIILRLINSNPNLSFSLSLTFSPSVIFFSCITIVGYESIDVT